MPESKDVPGRLMLALCASAPRNAILFMALLNNDLGKLRLIAAQSILSVTIFVTRP